MSKYINTIEYHLQTKLDESGITKLMSSLKAVETQATKSLSGNPAAMKQTLDAAKKIQAALVNAFDTDLGILNIKKFNTALGGINLSQIRSEFQRLGKDGSQAFNQLTYQMLSLNKGIKPTSLALEKLSNTMWNTVRWGITASIFQNITGEMQAAWTYAKDLDTSLNAIRIVTSKSADEMERFSFSANKAAKALGSSTKEYSDAALIFYQQGLGDIDSQKMAELTIKTANVTGQAADVASEQLTAVKNGYQLATGEMERYIDTMAAVAADTAADLEELSTAMSKVASSANMMGVDFDQLNAMLATVVSVTRQAPENVGTAFKTIFARLGDLKVDGVDEFGVKLGQISTQLRGMGINILDENENMRDMGDIMVEVAGKWDTWTQAQKLAAAQAMAGKRQYNNLVALFENWDMYSKEMNVAAEAEGTLAQQNIIYLNSIEAHLQKVKTTKEQVYNALFDTDSILATTDAASGLLSIVANLIESLGGGVPLVHGLVAAFTMLFSNQIASGLNKMLINIKSVLSLADSTKQVVQNVKDMYAGKVNFTTKEKGGGYLNTAAGEMVGFAQKVAPHAGTMSSDQRDYYQSLLGQIAETGEAYDDQVNSLQKAENAQKEYGKTAKETGLQLQTLGKRTKENGSEYDALTRKLSSLDRAQASNSKTITKLTAARDAEKLRLGQLTVATDNYVKTLENQAGIQRIVETTAAIGQLGFAIQSVSQLGSIWKNQDLSAGEKLLQTITSLSIAIPMVVSSFSQLSKVVAGLAFVQNLLAAAEEKAAVAATINQIVQMKAEGTSAAQIAASLLKSKTIDLETLSLGRKTLAEGKAAGMSMKDIAAKMTRIGISPALIAALTGETVAVDAANASWITFMATNPVGWIMGIVAALALVTAGVFAWIKMNEENNKFIIEQGKKAGEEAKNIQTLRKEYDALYNSYKTGNATKAQMFEMTKKINDSLKEESVRVAGLTGDWEAYSAALQQAEKDKTETAYSKASSSVTAAMENAKVADWMDKGQIDYETISLTSIPEEYNKLITAEYGPQAGFELNLGKTEKEQYQSYLELQQLLEDIATDPSMKEWGEENKDAVVALQKEAVKLGENFAGVDEALAIATDNANILYMLDKGNQGTVSSMGQLRQEVEELASKYQDAGMNASLAAEKARDFILANRDIDGSFAQANQINQQLTMTQEQGGFGISEEGKTRLLNQIQRDFKTDEEGTLELLVKLGVKPEDGIEGINRLLEKYENDSEFQLRLDAEFKVEKLQAQAAAGEDALKSLADGVELTEAQLIALSDMPGMEGFTPGTLEYTKAVYELTIALKEQAFAQAQANGQTALAEKLERELGSLKRDYDVAKARQAEKAYEDVATATQNLMQAQTEYDKIKNDSNATAFEKAAALAALTTAQDNFANSTNAAGLALRDLNFSMQGISSEAIMSAFTGLGVSAEYAAQATAAVSATASRSDAAAALDDLATAKGGYEALAPAAWNSALAIAANAAQSIDADIEFQEEEITSAVNAGKISSGLGNFEKAEVKSTRVRLLKKYNPNAMVKNQLLDGLAALAGVPAPKASGGGGGGGGGRTKTSDATKEAITYEKDRYHDIDKTISSLTASFERLGAAQEKLSGKKLIDNLRQQSALLKQQISAQATKLNLQRQEAAELRGILASKGVSFGAGGKVTNYNGILQEYTNQVNEAINRYNATSNQDAKEAIEKEIDARQETLDLVKEQIERYEGLIYEDIVGSEDEIQALKDQIVALQIEEFTIKISTVLDLAEVQKQWNEFETSIIENQDMNSAIGELVLGLKDIATYVNKTGTGTLDTLTQALSDINAEIAIMQAGGESSIFGTDMAAAIEKRDELMGQVIDTSLEYRDALNQIEEATINWLDEAAEKYDKIGEQYEYLNSTLEHQLNLVNLIYGEKAYDQLDSYYEAQKKINNEQMEYLQGRVAFFAGQMANSEEGSPAWEAAQVQMQEAQSQLNELVESAVDNIIAQYSNSINSILQNAINGLTGGLSLDSIEKDWQLINRQAKVYLDTTTESYELNKLQYSFTNAIAENTGVVAQARLNKLMKEQMGYLREKDKLTKYDVERAQMLLDIELKRIALEDAQNRKSTMKLQRDTQGNYSYVYAADQEAVAKAKQDLADAKQALYEKDKAAYEENLNNYLPAMKDWEEAQKELADTTLTEEERAAAEKRAQGLGDLIDTYAAENKYLVGNLGGDVVSEIGSPIQSVIDLIGEGGMSGISEEARTQIEAALAKARIEIDKVREISGQDFEDLAGAMTGTADKLGDIETALNKLNDTLALELDKLTQLFAELRNVEPLAHAALVLAAEATGTSLDQMKASASQAVSAATGMYTGAWSGGEGKLAMLHQKELVLNQSDTANLLAVISSVRGIVDMLKNKAQSAAFSASPTGQNLTVLPGTFGSSEAGPMQQTVHISADFPAVKTAIEIEKAFNNLYNTASQYANSNKK